MTARYRPDIDGLRAVAVLAVVAFHAFPALLPAGFVGVDVFFVISGFLISGIIYRELDGGTFTFLDFYARRVRRILPALILLLAACWFLGYELLLSNDFLYVGRHIYYGAAFSTNFLLCKEAGYFDSLASLKPLLHLWSLAIEEQFYLTWPVVLYGAWRLRWSVPKTIAAFVVASFVYNLRQVGVHPREAFLLLPSRFWELMLGAALAWREKDARAPRIPADLAAGAACVLFAAAFLAIGPDSAYPGWRALLPTLSTVLFLHAGTSAWINRRILSSDGLVLVGQISYPLYLWHWTLLSYCRIVARGEPGPWIIAAVVAASFLLAWLTWKFVELPLRTGSIGSLRTRGRRRAAVALGLAALAAAWGVGVVTWHTRGMPRRYPEMEAVEKDFLWVPAGVTDCAAAFGLPKDDYCWRTAGAPEVLVWGDSHANQLAPALAVEDGHPAVAVAQIGKGNCPALADVDRFDAGTPYGCAPAYARARALEESDFSTAKIVILAEQNPPEPSAPGYGGFRSLIPGDAGLSQDDVVERGLERTISRLEAAGKRVVLAFDVPELGFSPVDCFGARPFYPESWRRSSCFVARADVERHQSGFRRIAARLKAAHPRLVLFDPLPILCGEEKCEETVDGRRVYRDGAGHLTMDGSRRLGRPLDALISAARPAEAR